MTRHTLGGVLAGLAAFGFLGTAVLHSTGYDSVVELAAEVPSDLGPIMPGLWLIFSLDLAVVGLIVAVIAWRRPPVSSAILAIAAVQPIGAAGLQLVFIGFVPPTAILLAVAFVTLVASLVLHGQSAAPVRTATDV